MWIAGSYGTARMKGGRLSDFTITLAEGNIVIAIDLIEARHHYEANAVLPGCDSCVVPKGREPACDYASARYVTDVAIRFKNCPQKNPNELHQSKEHRCNTTSFPCCPHCQELETVHKSFRSSILSCSPVAYKSPPNLLVHTQNSDHFTC